MSARELFRRWLDGWRGVPIDIRSPLSIDLARARLREGTTSRWSPSGLDGHRRVTGRVRDDGTVRLEAGSSTVRNSWRPAAHCVLEPYGSGCRLLGVLRAPLPVLAFSAVWLSLAGCFFLIGLAATVVTLATGHVREAGAPAALLGGSAGFVAAGGGIMGVGFAIGRRDGIFLIEWLTDQLEAADPR